MPLVIGTRVGSPLRHWLLEGSLLHRAVDLSAVAPAPVVVVTEGRAEVALGKRDAGPLESRMGARTAPGPVERILDEARFDGVECEVAAGGDELRVAFDLTGHRVGAEEVRVAPLAAVVPARVFGMETLECLREPGVGNPQEGVVVAPHQHVGEQSELELPADNGQPLEEVFAVVVAYEQVTRIAAAR